MQTEAASKKERYRVHRGEPGQNIVTKLEGGDPVSESYPVGFPSSSSLPAIIPGETKAIILSPGDEKAHYRYDLITFFLKAEASQKGKLRSEIMDQFLSAYNTGHLFPDLYKKLGHASRPTLYRFLEAFNLGGIKDLAPHTGRKGISVITEDEKNFLLTIYYDKKQGQNRIKIGSAIRFMKYIFTQKNIPSPSSERTLRRYIDQFKKENFDLHVLSREGEKALNDKVLPYIPRDRNLLEVGDCLIADGHRLNFDVINPFTGKPCRAMMVLFLDWRSSYPVGWEIMLEESTQCIASALRNAILTLGKIPKWLLIDNGKAFKAKVFNSDIDLEEAGISGMFLRLGINAHFSQPYNAQAKISERLWRTFTDWFERLMPSFRGSCIGDKPGYLMRNEKLAQSAHDPWVPKISEVNDLMYGWREFYSDQPSRGLDGKTPREIFDVGKGPGVDPVRLSLLMMSREIKNIGRNGIDLFGCFWYDEALYGLRDQVVIKYSLSDLSQIYCFYKNEFLCTLKPRPKAHPMASESGTPKDLEDVKRMIAQKKSLKKQTVKLYRLLGKKQEQLPWREIIQEVPSVLEAIEKIEAEKPKAKRLSPFDDGFTYRDESEAKAKRLSPFVDGVTYSDESDRRRPEFISPFIDEPEADVEALGDATTNQRPRWEYDFEKYDWVMEQGTLTPDDRKWIDWYRNFSSGLKHKIFTDEEELDRKVMLYEESKNLQKYKPPRDWSEFKGEWWEKYDYLLAQDPATLTQEDLEFIDGYRTTSEYRAIYEVKPDRFSPEDKR